ncbi:MAG: L,D-transpeptidase family protein [Thermomicrobiales bacterium]|nr:L,D-transpeptidase family protein [Thermomicrobiales bacterium]
MRTRQGTATDRWSGRWWRMLATLGMTLALAGMAAAGAGAEWTGEVTAQSLNVRAEPGEWADVVGVLDRGEIVEIVDGPNAEGWMRVGNGSIQGWVVGGALATGEGPAPAEWTEATAAPAAETPVETPSGGDRWVDVDRSSQTVTLYDGGAPVASYWAAMGSDASADGFYATAIGTYFVYEKIDGLSYTPYAGAWVDDWVGFDPDRFNGFHSFTLDQNGWQIPGGDGPTGGCVALPMDAADRVFGFVTVGTRVEVHW